MAGKYNSYDLNKLTCDEALELLASCEYCGGYWRSPLSDYGLDNEQYTTLLEIVAYDALAKYRASQAQKPEFRNLFDGKTDIELAS